MPSDKNMASSKRGLPVTSKIDNDAISEEISRAMFAATKPPDTTISIPIAHRVLGEMTVELLSLGKCSR